MSDLTSYEQAVQDVESLELGIEQDMFDEVIALSDDNYQLKVDGIGFNAYDLDAVLGLIEQKNDEITLLQKRIDSLRV